MRSNKISAISFINGRVGCKFDLCSSGVFFIQHGHKIDIQWPSIKRKTNCPKLGYSFCRVRLNGRKQVETYTGALTVLRRELYENWEFFQRHSNDILWGNRACEWDEQFSELLNLPQMGEYKMKENVWVYVILSTFFFVFPFLFLNSPYGFNPLSER